MTQLVAHFPKCEIRLEGDTNRDVFKKFAEMADVFAERKCALCQSEDITPRLRIATGDKGKKFEYLSWQCNNPKCRAQLNIGQYNDGGIGGLFAKRRLDRDGNPDGENIDFGAHNGWTRYRGEPVDNRPLPAEHTEPTPPKPGAGQKPQQPEPQPSQPTAPEPAPKPAPKPATGGKAPDGISATPAQVESIRNIASTKGISMERVLARAKKLHNVNALDDLDVVQADKMIDALSKQP